MIGTARLLQVTASFFLVSLCTVEARELIANQVDAQTRPGFVASNRETHELQQDHMPLNDSTEKVTRHLLSLHWKNLSKLLFIAMKIIKREVLHDADNSLVESTSSAMLDYEPAAIVPIFMKSTPAKIEFLPSILGIKSCQDSNLRILHVEGELNEVEYGNYVEEEQSQTEFSCSAPERDLDFPNLVDVHISREIKGTKMVEEKDSAHNFSYSLLFDSVTSLIVGALFLLFGRVIIFKQGTLNTTPEFEDIDEYDTYLEAVLSSAHRLSSLSEFAQAKEIISRAISACYQSKFSKRHDPGTLFHLLSTVEFNVGNYEAALNAINNAYEIYENSLGASRETAYLLEDRGTILQKLGQFDQAKSSMQIAMEYLRSGVQVRGSADEMRTGYHSVEDSTIDSDLNDYKASLIARAKDSIFSESNDEGENKVDTHFVSDLSSTLVVQDVVGKRDTARLINQIGNVEMCVNNWAGALERYHESIDLYWHTQGGGIPMNNEIENAVDHNVRLAMVSSLASHKFAPSCCPSIDHYSFESIHEGRRENLLRMNTAQVQINEDIDEKGAKDEEMNHSFGETNYAASKYSYRKIKCDHGDSPEGGDRGVSPVDITSTLICD